jgi:hypothetical protein
MLGQKQNPRREWRRFAPPFSSWVLCPHTLGDSYNKKTKSKYCEAALRAASQYLGLQVAIAIDS